MIFYLFFSFLDSILSQQDDSVFEASIGEQQVQTSRTDGAATVSELVSLGGNTSEDITSIASPTAEAERAKSSDEKSADMKSPMVKKELKIKFPF